MCEERYMENTILTTNTDWDVKDLVDEIKATMDKETFIQFLIVLGIANNEGDQHDR
jgi:hypothetical protein